MGVKMSFNQTNLFNMLRCNVYDVPRQPNLEVKSKHKALD